MCDLFWEFLHRGESLACRCDTVKPQIWSTAAAGLIHFEALKCVSAFHCAEKRTSYFMLLFSYTSNLSSTKQKTTRLICTSASITTSLLHPLHIRKKWNALLLSITCTSASITTLLLHPLHPRKKRNDLLFSSICTSLCITSLLHTLHTVKKRNYLFFSSICTSLNITKLRLHPVHTRKEE